MSELYMVAIGFSAGGLAPVLDFFEHTPNDNVVYVILQHLPDGFQTRLDKLLARHARLPACVANDGVRIETDTVYVQPAIGYLTIQDGCFRVIDRGEKPFPNKAVDIFFASMAEAFGKRSIGVILSGTGSDGETGIKAVKKAGGIVISQDLETSDFSAMPFTAINTGRVDHVVLPREMPRIIRAHIDGQLKKQER